MGTGYKVTEAGRPEQGHIVIMSGPAGAGRSTAIGALEDLGFEAIDNLPISFLPRLFAGGAVERPVVIGIDPRNRDFSVDRMLAALVEVEAAAGRAPVLVYLDCDAITLARRYSETRRRHPLEPARDGGDRHRAGARAARAAARAGGRSDRHAGDDAARAPRRDGPAVRRGGCGAAAGWR